MTLDTRFFDKVDASASCWLWKASINGGGYGQFRLDGKLRKAHRVAWEMLVGPIPEGRHLDHLCRVRNCVNPDHLEPVTQAENIRRGNVGKHNPVKTHCPQGHEYAGDNTYRKPPGYRECRTCNRERQRRWRADNHNKQKEVSS